MKWSVFALLCVGFLCTCGLAQDKEGVDSTVAGVRAAERVFNGAYENLDAAVLDRMLADEFTVGYSGQETQKSKENWLGELGQLRVVFPQLRIRTDSLQVTPYGGLFVVQGLRTFTWKSEGEAGSYRERFTNRWRKDADTWQLTATQLERIR